MAARRASTGKKYNEANEHEPSDNEGMAVAQDTYSSVATLKITTMRVTSCSLDGKLSRQDWADACRSRDRSCSSSSSTSSTSSTASDRRFGPRVSETPFAGASSVMEHMLAGGMFIRWLKRNSFHISLLSVFSLLMYHIMKMLPFSDNHHRITATIMLAGGSSFSMMLLSGLLSTFKAPPHLHEALLDRCVNFSSNWRLHPLRTWVESILWLTALISAYSLSHSILMSTIVSVFFGLALTLFTEAAKSLFGRAEASARAAFISSFSSVSAAALSIVISLAFFIIVSEWRFATSSDMIPAKFEHVSIPYLLMIPVSASFICAGELFVQWGPTHFIGILLRERLVNAKRNWEMHTLRSFMEVFCALIVTWATYNTLQDAFLSIQLGTLSGVLMVLLGDWYCNRLRGGTESAEGESADINGEHGFKLLPLLCVVGYFGMQAVDLIFSNFHDIAVAFVLATLACVPLVFITEFLLLWTPTRIAAGTLQNRWVRVRWNWKTYPVRSFIEFGCLVGVIYGTYALYKDFATAVKIGTMSSVIVVLSGEYVRRQWTNTQKGAGADSSKLVPLVLMLVAYVGSMAFNTIYTYLNRIEIAFVLATGVSVGCVCLGEVFVAWQPTFTAGFILQDRLVNVKSNWQQFPVRSLIELGIWIGVGYVTYALYYDPFVAIQVATLSGIIVALTAEYILKKLIPRGFDVEPAAVPSLSMLALVSYSMCTAMYLIYINIRSIETTFFLATMAGVMFAVVSQLMIMWTPTRTAGAVLQGRILNSSGNWKSNPMRSFTEVGSWLGVIYGSYALYGDILVALQLGTLSAIVVVLSGEYFRNNLRISSLPSSADSPDGTVRDSKMIPFICILGYIGAGAYNRIFENSRAIETAIILATMTSVAIIVVGDLFVSWGPTRNAGNVIQRRVLEFKENWTLYPLRTFVENGCLFGVTYGTYAIYSDLAVAVQCGVFSVLLIILAEESIGSNIDIVKRRLADAPPSTSNTLPSVPTAASASPPKPNSENPSRPSASSSGSNTNKILPLPLILIFGGAGSIVFNTIYSHLKNIQIAFILATVTGIAFIVAGDLFVIWSPTRTAGLILQRRVLEMRSNWQEHPFRSTLEVVSTLCVSWCTWRLTLDLISAIQWATVACISIVLLGEWLALRISLLGDEMSRTTSLQGLADSASLSESKLLKLPYDTLFEVATYLTPEELLQVRLCNKHINQMLTAEAARYWMHVSIHLRSAIKRAGFGDREDLQIRSTVYEAVKVLQWSCAFTFREIRKLLRPQQLSSDSPQFLRWVHANHQWIRKQNMPKLAQDLVVLRPGDPGYDIFWHIPQKDQLRITVHRALDGETNIRIPGALYAKIQQDPLSYVASETVGMSGNVTYLGLLPLSVMAMAVMLVLTSLQRALEPLMT